MSVLQMVQKNMTLIFLQRSLLFLCTNKSVCLHMLVPLVFLSSFCSLKLNDFNFKNGHWATFSSACKAEVIQGYADASPNWKLSLLVTVMCLLLCVCVSLCDREEFINDIYYALRKNLTKNTHT